MQTKMTKDIVKHMMNHREKNSDNLFAYLLKVSCFEIHFVTSGLAMPF